MMRRHLYASGIPALLLVCTLSAAQSNVGEAKKKTATASRSSSTDAAESGLRIRTELNPHDSAAHRQLVDMLEKRGAFRAIVTEQANWLRNNPDDAGSLIQLASYAKTALHDPEYAIAQERWVLDHLKRADDDEQYDRDMDALSADLDKRGRSQEALKMMDELARLNPDDAGLWADRSMPLLHLGRTREAIQSLRKSLELDPSLETTHEALADALVQSGELAAAETEYRAALSTYNAKYKKGETTNSIDSLVKGLVKVEAAHHAEHSLAQTHLKLARVLMDQKKWGEAVSETQAALDADTYELSAHYLRAQIYDAQGDHESATKSRQAATAAVTQSAKTDKGGSEIEIDPRVVFLLSSGDDVNKPSTMYPLDIVSILEPRITGLKPMERVILADAFLDLGRVPDAVAQFDQGIGSDSRFNTAVAHANFGQRLLQANAFREALPHLQRAYELDPQNMTYRMDYQMIRETVEQKRPSP